MLKFECCDNFFLNRWVLQTVCSDRLWCWLCCAGSVRLQRYLYAHIVVCFAGDAWLRIKKITSALKLRIFKKQTTNRTSNGKWCYFDTKNKLVRWFYYYIYSQTIPICTYNRLKTKCYWKILCNDVILFSKYNIFYIFRHYWVLSVLTYQILLILSNVYKLPIITILIRRVGTNVI